VACAAGTTQDVASELQRGVDVNDALPESAKEHVEFAYEEGNRKIIVTRIGVASLCAVVAGGGRRLTCIAALTCAAGVAVTVALRALQPALERRSQAPLPAGERAEYAVRGIGLLRGARPRCRARCTWACRGDTCLRCGVTFAQREDLPEAITRFEVERAEVVKHLSLQQSAIDAITPDVTRAEAELRFLRQASQASTADVTQAERELSQQLSTVEVRRATLAPSLQSCRCDRAV
jgi:hypothetical protein